MEWNIYKEWLDINLYRQMVSMIYQSSSREDKMNFMRKEKENDLFYGAYKQSLEEEYGLYYPDEVLERINAHRSMTKPVYRALGLALAKSDYLQEKCMFNGTQKSRFWKQFGKVLGKKDLCCISVGCLLSEKDRKSWFDELYAYPYEKVEEMVFILSVFPEDITLWQLLKGKVAACLGSRRTISVYEDWPVYAWVTGKYDKRLKNDRTKDVAVLKRLMKLSRINAENANGILIGQLEKSGYTKEEVIFLNGVLTRSESGLGQLDQESLTAEKIAVNVLKTFLPGKEPYPDAVYKLCKTLLCQYDLLPVRIDGNEKIQQCLKTADIVITTGGVSVGKKDLLPEVLEELGAKKIFSHANIQPGTPTIGSVLDGKAILSLSGNPYAAYANFEYYFWELAAYLTQNASLKVRRTQAVLSDPYPKVNKLRRFVRAYAEEGRVTLPTAVHASSVLSNMRDCNCFIDMEPGRELHPGDEVKIQYFQ